MFNQLPKQVRVVEVAPRDGLQNEKQTVPAETKVRFIEMLADAGLPVVEPTSFVSPKWVPQLADAAEVMAQLHRLPGVRYPVLVPNAKGLERAIEAGAKEIALFTAASETFCLRNMNMTIEQSLNGFRELMPQARSAKLWIRVYISTAFVCPYEGTISPKQVMQTVTPLQEMGPDEYSIGDTIGAAVPTQVARLTEQLLTSIPVEQLAYHFHDTRGTALANVLTALQRGISIFDSSAGGLGGCPFAPGAAGNLATEDLIYMLDGMNIETGVSIDKVAKASLYLLKHLNRPSSSKYLLTCPQEI